MGGELGLPCEATTFCCEFASPGFALAPLLKITIRVALSGLCPAPLVSQ